MDFEILLFRTHDELCQFMRSSDRVRTSGISRRILSDKVLLVTKDQTVQPRDWGLYQWTGFRSVCGDCNPTWYETEELHTIDRKKLTKSKAPFVEVFRGQDLVLVHPESESFGEDKGGKWE